jgi:hypothetical protein
LKEKQSDFERNKSGFGGIKRENQKERNDFGFHLVRSVSKEVGSGLLSHAASSTVPSALVGLTSGFGMGPGVPPQL